VEEYGARMVVISDVFGVLADERSEVEEGEARRLAETVRRGIDAVRKEALVFTTIVTSTPHDAVITGCADVLVSLEESDPCIRGELLKHPFMRPTSRQFTLRDLLFHNKHAAQERGA
ncbi:MAG: hypothetical protein ACRD6W_05305, partial [Nitrososphaerales archaeon]